MCHGASGTPRSRLHTPCHYLRVLTSRLLTVKNHDPSRGEMVSLNPVAVSITL